jgi:hypothetical protein
MPEGPRSLPTILITGGCGRHRRDASAAAARPGRILRLLDVAPLTAGTCEAVTRGARSPSSPCRPPNWPLHPADCAIRHELYLMCDDIHATLAEGRIKLPGRF